MVELLHGGGVGIKSRRVSGRNESNDDQNKGIRANERISRRGVMDMIVKD